MTNLVLKQDTVRSASPSNLTILAGYSVVKSCRKILVLSEHGNIRLLVDYGYNNFFVISGDIAVHCGVMRTKSKQLLLDTKPTATFTLPCGCLCVRLTDTQIAAQVENKHFYAKYLPHTVDER